MDENNQPIVYVIDARNAGGDHRTGSGGNTVVSRAMPMPVGATRAPMVATSYPPGAYYRQPAYAYAQPVYAPPAPASSLFGSLTKGQVVDLIIQGLVALTPLPAAPVATGDIGTDVQNHVLYQGALAQHAKRDEQLRTLGYGIRRLLA